MKSTRGVIHLPYPISHGVKHVIFFLNQFVGEHWLGETLLVPKGPLLLGGDVLDPALLHVVLSEPAQEDGVPELRGDAEVLAASHQGIGLAALDGGRETLSREVVVDTLRLRDEADGALVSVAVGKAYETYRPLTMSAYSRVTILVPTTTSPRFTIPHPIGPNASFNRRLYLTSGR